MARAVAAAGRGKDLQARFFWLKACDLFLEGLPVVEVGFELDAPKAFDDVALFYDPPIASASGDVTADYFQLKHHERQEGAFTAEALVSPKFIGAKTRSLLERLRDAQQQFAPGGIGARFLIVSQWPILPRDPLSEIYRNDEGELDLDKLLMSRKRSMARLRSMWADHLTLDDEADLRVLLAPLRILHSVGTLDELACRAGDRLVLAGWRSYADASCRTRYDELPWAQHKKRRRRFSAETLRAVGEQQGLYVGPPVQRAPEPLVVISSFERTPGVDHAGRAQLLSLKGHFDGRWPREGHDWEGVVIPQVTKFLEHLDVGSKRIRVELPTHLTVAFAAGMTLDAKSGMIAVPVQHGEHGGPWPAEPSIPSIDAGLWGVSRVALEGGGEDLAVAVSVTHDIGNEVGAFLVDTGSEAATLIQLRLAPAPAQNAVRGGAHAAALARTAVATIRRELLGLPRHATVHLFFAGPNALAFRFGQSARVLGRCALYEHDFERTRDLPYYRSATLPLSNH